MKSCPRCARENDDDVRFCGRCGLDFVDYEKHQARTNSVDAQFCYRHPKEQTNLSCGRCGNPICTKCAQIGPAGPRCPDCAKHNVAFRPGGVVLEAKRTVYGLGRMGPWGIYIIAGLVISLIGGLVRGCGSSHQMTTPPNYPSRSDESDGDSGLVNR